MHDLEHGGLTNDYLVTVSADLALRYNDKVRDAHEPPGGTLVIGSMDRGLCNATASGADGKGATTISATKLLDLPPLLSLIVSLATLKGLSLFIHHPHHAAVPQSPGNVDNCPQAPLENHHVASAFSLLRRPEHNILGSMSRSERARLRKLVIDLVLATDMKQHFPIISHFSTLHRLGPSPGSPVAPGQAAPATAAAPLPTAAQPARASLTPE